MYYTWLQTSKRKIKYLLHKALNTDDQNFLISQFTIIIFLAKHYPAIYSNWESVTLRTIFSTCRGNIGRRYFRNFVDLVFAFPFFSYNPTYYIIIAVSVPAFLGDVETSSFLDTVVIALYLINFRLLCSPFLELLLWSFESMYTRVLFGFWFLKVLPKNLSGYVFECQQNKLILIQPSRRSRGSLGT